jgi:hypothetical protein
MRSRCGVVCAALFCAVGRDGWYQLRLRGNTEITDEHARPATTARWIASRMLFLPPSGCPSSRCNSGSPANQCRDRHRAGSWWPRPSIWPGGAAGGMHHQRPCRPARWRGDGRIHLADGIRDSRGPGEGEVIDHSLELQRAVAGFATLDVLPLPFGRHAELLAEDEVAQGSRDHHESVLKVRGICATETKRDSRPFERK